MNRYFCPMHRNFTAREPARCPRCGMSLVASNSRYPLLANVFGDPVYLAVMAAIILVFMAGAMTVMR
jgi:hypothetical protein